MRQRLNRISRLKPRTVLGEDEKIIGTHTDGRPIIERTYTKDVREAVLNENGEQSWKINQLGIPTVPIYEIRPKNHTEVYIWDELPTGHNHKNYDFRVDPAEIERNEKKDRVETLKDEFFEAAEERGLSADDIAGFIADGREESKSDATGFIEVEEVEGDEIAALPDRRLPRRRKPQTTVT